MSTGKEVRAAFKKAVTWGQAVAVDQAAALLITSEAIATSREYLPDDSAGQDFPSQADQGLVTCAGDLGTYCRYEGLEALWALALGAGGAPELVEGSTGVYRHTLDLAGDNDGLFGTLAVHKGFSVHQFNSCKIDGFTLEGQAGQPLTLTWRLICDDRVINTGAGENPTALLTGLDAPTAGGRALFRQAEFRLNDAEGPALAAADVIRPGRFALSVKRGLAGDYLAGGGDRVAEPLPTGFPELGLTLEFPTYTSDTYLSDLGQDTRKKLRLDLVGGELEPGFPAGLSILIPHLALTNAEASVDHAGKITHPVTMSLLAPPAERAGMAGLVAPLRIILTGTRAQDPLS